MTLESARAVERRAAELFTSYQRDIYKSTDRLFAGLMGFQWLAGIVFALWVSPLAWYGSVSRTHIHVWAAIVLGGIISLFPALLGLLRPGRPSTRYTIAVAQMLMAFLAFYRDWRVLIPATIVVALDHMLRGMFWPQSVYGVLVVSQWRWVEHAAWVVFEDVFLVVSCIRSVAEMRDTAERTATLEQEIRTRQQAETDAKNAWARNDGILDVALDCVILMDESGRIVQFNPAAERTFGYSAAEAVGTPLAELIVPQEHVGSDREGLVRYLTNGPTAVLNRRLELSAVRKGGEIFPVEVAIAPISAEGAAMFAGYMRDITERRQAETALAVYTRDLEQAHDTERQNAEQLAKLVDQLRVTQGQAEAATRAKSDFLASMSHELRTPLNAIILYSELLQEEADEHDTERSVADLQKIQSAGKHLLDLINGILDLSKIEAGKMTLSLERFEIRAMLDDLLDTVGPLVEQRSNVLTVNCGDDVGSMVADFMKVRQILLNLLSNAGKFTRDGAISLDVQRIVVDGRPFVRFTVTDTGVGMTSQQSDKVFDPFTQADVTTTRKYGGTGLGLAIVSRFCQLMGGSVGVESRPGHGSSFFIHLPIEVVDESAESSRPAGVAGTA